MTPPRITSPGSRLLLALIALPIVGGWSSGCDDDDVVASYSWDLPSHFPEPAVPDDNPMSEEKVELGRHLFYDTLLSANETFSCASCHLQSLAFTDGLARSAGETGDIHPRSSMSLANVAYTATLTWANPLIVELEAQAQGPLFGEDPVELGVTSFEDMLLPRFADSPIYPDLFAAAFPSESEPINLPNMLRAIASFQRTLISGNAPYDRYVNGDATALTEEEVRGMNLFFSERLECFHCHGGFNFSNSVNHANVIAAEVTFHNTGLYNLDGNGAYPPNNTGVFSVTGNPADMGRFRAPTLRNIEVTAPYMHDGSIATLREVIHHYAEGGRTISEGPNAGVGSESPLKDSLVPGFIIEESEIDDLIAFLRSLTDTEFLTDPRFASPFE